MRAGVPKSELDKTPQYYGFAIPRPAETIPVDFAIMQANLDPVEDPIGMIANTKPMRAIGNGLKQIRENPDLAFGLAMAPAAAAYEYGIAPLWNYGELAVGNAVGRALPWGERLAEPTAKVVVGGVKGAVDTLIAPGFWWDPSAGAVVRNTLTGAAGKAGGEAVQGVLPKGKVPGGPLAKKIATKAGEKAGAKAAGAIYERGAERKKGKPKRG